MSRVYCNQTEYDAAEHPDFYAVERKPLEYCCVGCRTDVGESIFRDQVVAAKTCPECDRPLCRKCADLDEEISERCAQCVGELTEAKEENDAE